MRKILITGCSGFIGHHLIQEAKKNKWIVYGVDKRPISYSHAEPDHFIQTDVKDLNYRDLMDIDAVVHLAWRTNIADCLRHPEDSTADNIDMTVHLLEVCREAGISKIVFPSTASLYSYNKTPWTEDMEVEPIEMYSWQKLACEHLCQMYSKQFNLPSVILRFFQVFGEFQRADTAIAVFNKLIARGEPVTLTKTTDKKGSSQRDFIYAGDVAKAIIASITSKEVGKGEVINICTNELTNMEEIATAMHAKITWIPKRPYDVDVHLGDNKKARLLINWKPEVNVIEWLNKEKI